MARYQIAYQSNSREHTHTLIGSLPLNLSLLLPVTVVFEARAHCPAYQRIASVVIDQPEWNEGGQQL